MTIHGIKVAATPATRWWDAKSGKIQIDGGRVALQTFLAKVDLFGLSEIKALENKGARLVVRLPHTFWVLDFLQSDAAKALPYKEELSRLANVPLTECTQPTSNVRQLVIGGIVGVLLIVGVIGGVIVDDDKPAPKESQEAQAAANDREGQESPAPTPDPIKSGHDLGERIVIGDFAYVVKGGAVKATVGSSFAKQKAQDGAVFLIVAYTIENLGKETQTVLADNLKVRDTRGRTYSVSTEASTALMMSGAEKDFLFSELHPGIAKKALAPFEVPESVPKDGFKIIISDQGGEGLFGVARTEEVGPLKAE